ncbi:GNAT family N-acetyltransferase [Arcobacter sp. KX21116]|jgi:putative acetyltransferase|uniref:GNAT family N-acetyltransferase n=1 Tax=Arcobacter iocasae TaxID=2906515 RepID=UPI0035D460D2|tara:strand:+ start:60 stop:521 length:462 start_codon:yes stop_codon:yes gene_type:complete
MQIIKYNDKYKKEIPEIFTNTIHKTCNKEYTKEQLNAWANLHIDYKTWEERLNKTKPYLAILDEKLVGFAEFYDDYIDCFYVHHEYQGCGVGEMLINHIFKISKENEQTLLKVDASITAKPFFEKFGFKVLKKNRVKRGNIELTNFTMLLSHC